MPCEVPSTPYMVSQDMSYLHLSFFIDVPQLCKGKIEPNSDTIFQPDPSVTSHFYLNFTNTDLGALAVIHSE